MSTDHDLTPRAGASRGRTWAAPLAWLLWAVSVLLFAAGLVSTLLPAAAGLPERPEPMDVLVFGIAILAFPTVGALIASRQPGNLIGWLFCAIGLSMVVAIGSNEYAVWARFGQFPLPAIEFAAWLSSWLYMLGLTLAITVVPLLFPTGRPPSRRWGAVAWAVGAAIALLIVSTAVRPGTLDTTSGLPNPFGVEGILGEVATRVVDATILIIAAGALASIAGFATRFARSHGTARQQLKWVVYAVSVMTAGVISISLPVPLGFADALSDLPDWTWWLFILGVALIPVAAGIAILRHRLYDIDLLINRTVVYAALTATLGAVYVGGVVLLQGALAGLTGGSSLAVAASTLAVAALFRPLRQRIQRAVDRRFYRSRYDAARTLEAFNARLRSEVDLGTLERELMGVIHSTLRPTAASVWLRPPATGE